MSTKSKRGRKRTGTLHARRLQDGSVQFYGRVRLADGTQAPPMTAERGISREKAKAWIAMYQAKEDHDGYLLAKKGEHDREVAKAIGEIPRGETCDEWFKRALQAKECGDYHRSVVGAQWNKWISPSLKDIPIATLTRDNVEKVRDALDEAIDAGKVRAKTARGIWSHLTSVLKAAHCAKDRTLRVHAHLPYPLHVGILPPKNGRSRKRCWLFPIEWEAFAACESIPVGWRRTVAIALYTGLRPFELKSLTHSDVDLVGNVIHVTKAFDKATRRNKTTKTEAGQRTISIHPNLRPLLASMEGEPTDLIAPELSLCESKLAIRFREYLKMANINRARLWASNDTDEPVDFRSLRDTFATWSALARVYPVDLKDALGHASLQMTEKYVKDASAYRNSDIGEPFGPIDSRIYGNKKRNDWTGPSHFMRLVAGEPGFESSRNASKQGLSYTYEHSPQTSPTQDYNTLRTSPDHFTETNRVPVQSVEDGLASALSEAAKAGRWDVVAQLARELEARRLAGSNVVSFDALKTVGVK